MRAESAAVLVGPKSLVDVSAMTVDDARAFFDALKLTGAAKKIATEVLKEIRSRLDFLAAVGVHAHQSPDALSLATAGVEQRLAALHSSRIDAKVGELAHVGIGHRLEDQGGHVASRIGPELDLGPRSRILGLIGPRLHR